jgi:hypothetical protein
MAPALGLRAEGSAYRAQTDEKQQWRVSSMKQLFYGLTALALFLGPIGTARADFIYWCEYSGGDIQRAHLDGSGKTTLVSRQSSPAGLSLDLVDGTMYWSEQGRGNIWQASLDGSGAAPLVRGIPTPASTALDIANRQIYWIDGAFAVGGIQRANFDGSGLTTLVSGLNSPEGIRLDLPHGKMYFSEGASGQEGFISRYNLDGSGRQTILRGLSHPNQMALDLAADKIYWAEPGSFTIRRANLDGSDPEILIRRQSEIPSLALDLADGKMYWSDFVTGMIERANLDGSDAEVLVTGLNGPAGIALQIELSPENRFRITALAPIVAGTPFDITVTALDPYGNIDTNYQGTVTFSSSDVYPGVLPADYTFTASDQGTHTFSGGVTFFSAGAQTLTVQDTSPNAITGSTTVAVVPARASHFLILASATAVSGTPFDVVLAALDPYLNVDGNYTGTATWTSSDTDPGVLLPAAYTFQASNHGAVTLPAGVTLFSLGNQTLTVTDPVSGLIGSATVTVGPGP